MKIGVNVPVAGSPNVTFGLALGLEGSRINGDVKLKGQVDAIFSANVDVYIANLFLSVKGFGYLEVKGDNGKECMDYLLYFMQLKLRSVSNDLEEYVFSPSFEEAVLTQMNSDEDNDDYIEAGIGVEGAAGVEAGGNTSEVKVEFTDGTKISGSQKEDFQMRTVTIKVGNLENEGEVEERHELGCTCQV